MNDFKEAILDLIKKNVPMTLIVGTVSEVDTGNDVCVVTPEDAPAHYDVKLRSIVQEDFGSRIVVYPKDGSKVLIGLIDNDPNNTALISISEFESILIEIQTSFKLRIKSDGQMLIDSDNIVFNSGANGGLVKSASTAAELNDIKTSLNTLKSLITSWTPVLGDGGTALKGVLATWSSSSLTSVVPSDLENIKIKH